MLITCKNEDTGLRFQDNFPILAKSIEQHPEFPDSYLITTVKGQFEIMKSSVIRIENDN